MNKNFFILTNNYYKFNKYLGDFEMYVYKSILMPTDFSQGAEEAFEHVKDIAKSMGSFVHLLHVIQPVVYPAGIELAHESLVNLQEELEQVAHINLGKLEKRLNDLGIKTKSTILLGTPSEQIAEYSLENNIDLIVIATHGASGIERFLFGSTTERVIRRAEIPVLVVHFKKKKD